MTATGREAQEKISVIEELNLFPGSPSFCVLLQQQRLATMEGAMKRRVTLIRPTLLVFLASLVLACGGSGSQSGGSSASSQPAAPGKSTASRGNEVTQSVQQGQTVVSQPKPAAQAITPASSRAATINGKRLSDQDIESLERTFRVRIRDGNYWYDRMNGSWGKQGGPAEGFILAGLNLGGPLREDASSGDTGVFINGRQLHRVDVARLQQIGPVYRSRCWMDAYGNIGLEGQPAFGNVWVAASQASGGGRKREGILSAYDKTGVAVLGY